MAPIVCVDQPAPERHAERGYPAPVALRFAYNTNGLAHHRPADALRLLADLGYGGAAVTPDVGALDPLGDWRAEAGRLRSLAERLGLALTLESGARYLLDPRRKHAPSLLDPDPAQRRRRRELLLAHLELAQALGCPGLSIWAGQAPGGLSGDASPGPADPQVPQAQDLDPQVLEALWSRLSEELSALLEAGAQRGVALWFEPEPGMFIERPAGYRLLRQRLGPAGEALGLTLDVGHCLCTGDLPVARVIADQARSLRHVHLADIRGGVHQHLPFGQGDLDLREVLAALAEADFRGLCAVELSRDSHRGPEAAAEALAALQAATPPAHQRRGAH
jgi:sugar phosphate isomerase/epimerase